MKLLIETRDLGIRGWERWKQLWDSIDVWEFRHSLLHFGFQFNLYQGEWTERILAYLQIADGWAIEECFMQERQEVRNGLSQQRQLLARKAFEVLCLKVFHKNEHGERTGVMRDAPILKATMDFFLKPPPQAYRRQLRNLPHRDRADHHLEAAYEFLDELVERYWDPDDASAELEASLPELRPRFIEVLSALGKLHVLLQDKYYKRVDEAALLTLEKLALEKELFVSQEGASRHPKTLKEAAYLGSTPARILLLLRTSFTEEKRLNEIQALKQAESEAARRRQELEGQRNA